MFGFGCFWNLFCLIFNNKLLCFVLLVFSPICCYGCVYMAVCVRRQMKPRINITTNENLGWFDIRYTYKQIKALSWIMQTCFICFHKQFFEGFIIFSAHIKAPLTRILYKLRQRFLVCICVFGCINVADTMYTACLSYYLQKLKSEELMMLGWCIRLFIVLQSYSYHKTAYRL